MKEKKEVEEFKEKSKDWYQRRGRSHKEEKISHKDIAKKYQAAFSNLSKELKRKIEDDYSKKYPYNYPGHSLEKQSK